MGTTSVPRILVSISRVVRAPLVLALVFGTVLARSTYLPALAVVDTIIEIDKNATDDGSAATDWNTLIGSSCAGAINSGPSPSSSTFLKAICIDDLPPGAEGNQESMHRTQSSKDINDLTTWDWQSVNSVTPAKDDIVNAYAAAWVQAQGGTNHLIVGFGLDRRAVNGDANASFWFFKETVTATSGTFSPGHSAGDVLIQSNYTNGGDIGRLSVYTWCISGDSSNPAICAGEPTGLKLVEEATGDPLPNPFCLQDNNACVATNTSNPNLSWRSDATAASVFFEGSADLTGLGLLGSGDCISSFMAGTRSSQSFSAERKDFALGSFNTCGKITIVKDTQPNGPTDFSFSVSPAITGVSSFLLDDDGDNTNTLSNTRVLLDVAPGTYTITEAAASGFTLANIVCTVDKAGASVQIGKNGVYNGNVFDAGDNAVQVVMGIGGEVTCTFTNVGRSMVIRKEAKDASTTATNDLLGGAGFTITPNPQTGSGTLVVTDNGTGDAYNNATTGVGLICIDNVLPGTYSVEETTVPANYKGAATQTNVSTSSGTCASRLAAAPTPGDARTLSGSAVDATFVNTPLSSIQVNFTSSAGTGKTRASISCSDSAGPITDSNRTTEQGAAEPAFDDTSETFQKLEPGTYTCTIVIDP